LKNLLGDALFYGIERLIIMFKPSIESSEVKEIKEGEDRRTNGMSGAYA
jgi:hypothetical protein